MYARGCYGVDGRPERGCAECDLSPMVADMGYTDPMIWLPRNVSVIMPRHRYVTEDGDEYFDGKGLHRWMSRCIWVCLDD